MHLSSPIFVPWASRQLTGNGRGMKTVLTGKKTPLLRELLDLQTRKKGIRYRGRDMSFAISNNAHVGWKQQKKPISFFLASTRAV